MFGKYALTLGLALAAAAGGWFGGAASAAAAPHATRPAVFARTSASEPPQLGAAVNDVMLAKAGPRYVDTLLAHYRSITPEWEMEMSQLEPARGRFTFGRADGIVAFAGRHRMPVRGHSLVWDHMVPGWVLHGDWTRRQLENVLRTYITTVVSHYRGEVEEWDVVNEPLTTDGHMRQSIWERVIGPDYVALAFRWAHAADPDARLFLNEYGAEWNDPKEHALFQLVSGLKAAGVPIGGVGFQAHLLLSAHPPQSELTGVLRRFAALGLRLEITELDVRAGGSAPLARRMAEEAAIYQAVAASCAAVRACARVTTWGITDAATWIGTANRPLPFDTHYRPKPAWYGLRAGLTPRG
jgi:endo-1,4-beta-xylanase